MFTFSNFQFVPNSQKLWHLKNQLFLLLHTAWISLAYALLPLPLTCDTHVVFLQWNISQCVEIWIFNISNTDSFTQTIYHWYKYYPKWICVSFSYTYICCMSECCIDICCISECCLDICCMSEYCKDVCCMSVCCRDICFMSEYCIDIVVRVNTV